MELAKCENEGAVKKILEQEGYWDDANAWRALGDIENNFGIVGDQQDSADTALVEKITNSVDAVLTAECWLARISPEDPVNSPPTMQKAVECFFGIPGGKLSEITSVRRTQLAEKNISLVATGNRQNPCIAIIDKGEGQSPERMPDTLLSLLKSNKVRVPFVQGIYNMGGSGALRFCSETHNLQLIISRRHPGIAENESGALKHKWSFTVVRRFEPREGDRVSNYRYLAPIDHELLTFESDGLPLLPGTASEAYCELLHWGTYIKLYQYQLRKFNTKITLDLYYRLSFLLPAIGLPVRLYERRAFEGHTPEETLSGLTVRLEEDSRKSDNDPNKNLEPGFPDSSAVTIRGQTMPASIYVFKKGQQTHYKKDEGIVFTVNGQTQGYIHKSFFEKDSVKLPILRESIVVMVDCSGLDRITRERLVLTSRDRLADLPLKHEIERAIAALLRNHRGLRELQKQRLDEEISNKLKDSKPLEDILRDILSKDYTLETVLLHGGRLPNPKKIEAAKTAKVFDGKRFPTYFSLCRDDYSAERPKLAQKNTRFRIQYKTDAANNYFYRDVESGTFGLTLDGQEMPNYSVNLWNGIATLNVELPKSSAIGDTHHFESVVTDDTRIEPFTHEFYVEVEPKQQASSSTSGSRRPPSSNAKGGNSKKSSSLAAPKIIPVREAEWDDQDPKFTKESAASVIETPDSGYLFKVNLDNIYLQKHMQKSKTDPKILEARFTIGMVLTGLGLLNRHRRELKRDLKDESTEAVDIYRTVREVTEAMSLVLLPMIDRLAELKETVLALGRESDIAY